MRLPLWRIAEFLSTEIDSRHGNAVASGYSIDSRTVAPGEVFFAVQGEKMDGHDFVADALKKGAAAAVVERAKFRSPDPGSPVIAVNDTLVALQTLATSVRRLWAKPLIAVTGSAGKTTTKEAIAHVLSSRFSVHKSEGNFNNHFGLPLMLLQVEPNDDIAVVEMGMSHAGEIAALARIAQPDTGVETNVAPVHLEFFDSIADIARAKYELIESLPATGTAVLNVDDEYVAQFGRGFEGKVITYGLGPTASVRAEHVEALGERGSRFDLVAGDHRTTATLPLVGNHNIYNGLAAVAVALDQGIPFADATSALSRLSPAEKRGQVVRIGNITVVNDCYNSNPKALAAMVDALASIAAKRRIVVAGEMLELGPQASEMHREGGRDMARKGIDVLVGVRGLAREMVDAAKAAGMAAEFVSRPEEAGEWLARETRDGDAVLLKASRGVKLEKALETWKEAAGRPSSASG